MSYDGVNDSPTSYLFPKRARLAGKKMIQALFKKGKRASFGPLQFYYLALPDLKENKALFVVPKKKIGKAVKRNKIRRQIREAYRCQYKTLAGPPFYLLAYLYGPKTNMPTSYALFVQNIQKSLKRVGKVISKKAANTCV